MELSLSLSLSLARRLLSGFSPSSLFSNNEPGIWLDPSDVANLDWRRNLLTYTEQFDNAIWTKLNATVTANAGVDPLGTSLADAVVEDATASAVHRVNISNIDVTSGRTYVFSVYAKAQSVNFLFLNLGTALFGTNSAVFNLSTGAVVSASGVTASIQNAGNGWYRCIVVATATASGVSQFFVSPSDNSSAAAYTGVNGRTSALIWGAQLELGSVATDYQRITDVNTEVLERFPKTTMYQDRAGSTAVTTPGQSVGLRLDKSKGLVLGPELVTNGDFSGGATGWTPQTGWTVGSGVASVNSAVAGTTNLNSTSVTVVAGMSYQITYTILSVSGSGIRATIGGATEGTFRATAGTFTVILTAASTTSFGLVAASNNTVATVDNISVKELPGNHAVANSDAARGIYGIEPFGGRRNLMLWTDGLTNAVWTNNNVTVAAPDAQGWVRIEATASLATNFNQSVAGAGSASRNTFTCQVKKGSGANDVNRFFFRNDTTATNLIDVRLNYDTGVITPVTGGADVTVTAGENAGEWVLKLTPSSGISAGDNLRVYPGFAGAAETAGEFAFMRNMQLEAGTVSTPYQRVTSQYDVTEAGKQTLHYVQYDGSDDGYVTSTIDPSTDKTQVFIGTRKFGTTTGVILELSSGASTGSFVAYNEAPSGWGFNSQGSIQRPAQVGTGFPSPITNVFTGLGDISGDRVTLRINGSQIAQGTADQGVSNYLAYPLYIGRRGGTSLPFNGRDYGIITRFGANLDASTISATESWLNQRTGAF